MHDQRAILIRFLPATTLCSFFLEFTYELMGWNRVRKSVSA